MSAPLPDPVRTRDRRDVGNIRVAEEITGDVPMIGTCRWRSDGRILATPTMVFSGDHAGPLDLVLEVPPSCDGPKHALLAVALAEPNGGGTCCD